MDLHVASVRSVPIFEKSSFLSDESRQRDCLPRHGDWDWLGDSRLRKNEAFESAAYLSLKGLNPPKTVAYSHLRLGDRSKIESRISKMSFHPTRFPFLLFPS